MNLFTYLLAKKGKNSLVHKDLFSYLLGKNNQETSILPSGYTQVDYIESTGTQYIDTGIKGQSGIKLEMNFMLNEMPSTNTPMSGSYNGTNSQRCYLGIIKSDGTLGMSYITTTFSTNVIQVAKKYNLYVDFTKGNQNLILDEINILTGNNNTDLVQTRNILLFGYDAGNGYDDRFPVKMKMFKSKLYIEDTLVRDFIPCYRDSDNEVGLYDLVTNEFYTNQGTGDFIYE